ncbi:MAG: hypothetical protein GYA24_03805 [Candidatus Lokiarchaeota archaeon]|nr:hypothetical protein [Candidatus Lokiarchaeota archaeon]
MQLRYVTSRVVTVDGKQETVYVMKKAIWSELWNVLKADSFDPRSIVAVMQKPVAANVIVTVTDTHVHGEGIAAQNARTDQLRKIAASLARSGREPRQPQRWHRARRRALESPYPHVVA